MNKSLAVLGALLCLSFGAARAADEAAAKEKFYGKITAIDLTQRHLTVHNARQKTDAQFKWDEKTGMKSQKKMIPPTELKVGQSLYVSYVMENDVKKATYISVRTPFKKAQE